MRRTVTFAALIFGLALSGCDSFDPLDKFQDLDIMATSKTPIRGERREVFPQGVPGVPQGVPADMVKGYQPPPEEPPPVVTAKPEKKAKPKKTAAAPRKQPREQPQEADIPQMQQAPAAQTTTQPVRQGAGGMQTMPGAQPTWPADAQPAPRR